MTFRMQYRHLQSFKGFSIEVLSASLIVSVKFVDFLQKRFALSSRKNHYQKEFEISGRESLLYFNGCFESIKKMSDAEKEDHQMQILEDVDLGPLFKYKAIKKKVKELVKKQKRNPKCFDVTQEIQEMLEEKQGELGSLYFILPSDYVTDFSENFNISRNKFCLDIVYCIRKKASDSKAILKRKLNFNYSSGMILWVQPSDVNLFKEMGEHRDPRESSTERGSQESKEFTMFKEFTELKETKERKEFKQIHEFKEFTNMSEHREFTEIKDSKEVREFRKFTEISEFKKRKGFKEFKEFKELKEF